MPNPTPPAGVSNMTEVIEQPGIRLFVGGHAGTVQGEREDLAGDRCFTAAHPPQAARFRAASDVVGLLDSGAFTDPPHRRLTPDQALDRQLRWEGWATRIWEADQPWRAQALVSYDLLIDEKWVEGKRYKERWDIKEADRAVEETVEAARYLASQREQTGTRTLVLSCQGVDAFQYQECVSEVLKVTRPGDWIGLGGWCILGMRQAWMPTFWQTMRVVLPQIARAGIRHIHIFGVLFQKALGGLRWLADQLPDDLSISTDSTAPVLACTWKNWKKAGARDPYWRNNVNWWKITLANIRTSEYYKEPPRLVPTRQEAFAW